MKAGPLKSNGQDVFGGDDGDGDGSGGTEYLRMTFRDESTTYKVSEVGVTLTKRYPLPVTAKFVVTVVTPPAGVTRRTSKYDEKPSTVYIVPLESIAREKGL